MLAGLWGRAKREAGARQTTVPAGRWTTTASEKSPPPARGGPVRFGAFKTGGLAPGPRG